LDDEQLVNTLQTSKATSQEVSEQLATAETTEAKIDSAREVRSQTCMDLCNKLINMYMTAQ